MTNIAPRPRDDTARMIKRILLLLGFGMVVVVAAASVVAFTYYRQYRHKEAFRATIRAVDAEQAERERFEDDARARLLAGDFEGLDSLARELRATRATFANGTWKLTILYDGLGGPSESEPWSGEDWTRALEQSQRWVRERPDSIAARLVATDLWISYAWEARGDGWSHEVAPEQDALFRKRIDEATSVIDGARGVAEACPGRADRLIALALAGSVSGADEAATFEQAVREHPEYQPVYTRHLRYLQPRWYGKPGELTRAAHAVAALPGGREKLVRALWSFDRTNSLDTSIAPWPVVKQGFAEMRTRYPESLEVLSASCLFAHYYGDRAETIALLERIGGRMAPSVWRGEHRFVGVYQWATFEQGEVAGGDPLARFFAWLMRS